MSMADDNRLRSYRSNDPYRRSDQQADTPIDDPLAELVRLIGQPDPFTDDIRSSSHARGAPQAPRAPRAPQASYRDQDEAPAGDWRRHVQRPNFDTDPGPAFDQDPRYGSTDGYGAEPVQHPPAQEDYDPYRMGLSQADRYSDQPYAESGYSADRGDFRRAPTYASAAAGYADEPIYAAQRPGRSADHGYGGGVAGADEDYDDPPRRKRGSSLYTALVLIGCAMLGTAGAYGYRTYMESAGSKQAPVIIADTSPSKIVPAEKKSTRVQDRSSGQRGDERLVSREEQPVALQVPGSVPRVVFPSPIQPSTTGSTPGAASNAQALPPGSSTDQPKRVRTVPIRPDGGDNAGQPFGDAPTRAAPPPAARTAVPPPPAARASRDQPLSLDPGASPPVSPPARAQSPREAAPAEPRLASIPPSGGAASYLVQVSSQRSESDAQASFKALQDKYSQLRSRQPIIRRADLGAKGIYYRALVGPFSSSEEANQFCSSLKQAGGQCITLRN